MPIYEYVCTECGHEEEVIQKISEKPLTKCPKCNKQKLKKLVSSSAFQLKGEGWYVTDFKDKNKKTAATATDGETTSKNTPDSKSEDSATTTTTDAKTSDATAVSTKQKETKAADKAATSKD